MYHMCHQDSLKVVQCFLIAGLQHVSLFDFTSKAMFIVEGKQPLNFEIHMFSRERSKVLCQSTKNNILFKPQGRRTAAAIIVQTAHEHLYPT